MGAEVLRGFYCTKIDGSRTSFITISTRNSSIYSPWSRFHPEELLKEIELVINSQKLFNYCKDTLHLTDIQKAAGTLIKYGWSFSAQGTSYAFEGRNSAQTLISKISLLRECFRNVAISNESFEKCIKRWDKENTFLYPDPPYFGAENIYPGINFGLER